MVLQNISFSSSLLAMLTCTLKFPPIIILLCFIRWFATQSENSSMNVERITGLFIEYGGLHIAMMAIEVFLFLSDHTAYSNDFLTPYSSVLTDKDDLYIRASPPSGLFGLFDVTIL